MRLFSKADKKSKKPSTSDEEPHLPQPRSPTKKSTSSKSKSNRAGDENHKVEKVEQGSSRKSRHTVHKSRSSSKAKYDEPDTHPLNLSLDQIKRLSALSNLSTMSDPMDVESEPQNGVPSSSLAQENMPGSFETPKTNGTSPSGDAAPAPPPHKSNPTSPATPAAPTPEEAEAFKANGNKFYKNKEYKKAIEEYTRGRLFRSEPLMSFHTDLQQLLKHNRLHRHTSATAQPHTLGKAYMPRL